MSLPQLVVECAFNTDPDVAVPAYEDISDYVLGFGMKRGRQHELDTVQAGICDIRLNNGDRRFDPTYTHSPYYPYVLPMRKVRVSAVWSSVTYYLFTGYVERWPIDWEAPKWGSVTITVTDGMAALQQATISGTFPEELTGSRIDRVLSAATWPESTPAVGGYWTLDTSQLGTTTILSYGLPSTLLDDGQTTVAEVTFAEDSATSALAHIQEVVAAERGMFFIDGQGRAVFQDRNSRYAATNEVTYTDGSTSASRIPYQDLEPEFDVEQVENEVIVTATGGTAQTATDGVSRSRYFRRTLTLSLPLTSDAEALARANYELWQRKAPRLEFTRIDIKPQKLDAAWPHALGRELSDRVAVEWTPKTIPAVPSELIDRDCFTESVEHRASGREWQTTYQLSPADTYDQFFELGVAALDSPTTAVLAY